MAHCCQCIFHFPPHLAQCTYLVCSCKHRQVCNILVTQFLPHHFWFVVKPSEIGMKDGISHPPAGVLVFSFQLAITPPPYSASRLVHCGVNWSCTHTWGMGIISNSLISHLPSANGHITLNTPVLVRSLKLSSVEPSQYLDG